MHRGRVHALAQKLISRPGIFPPYGARTRSSSRARMADVIAAPSRPDRSFNRAVSGHQRDSVRGRSLTFSRNSSPDMRGITTSVGPCGPTALPEAPGRTRRFGFEMTKPNASPTVTQKLATCSSSRSADECEDLLLPGYSLTFQNHETTSINCCTRKVSPRRCRSDAWWRRLFVGDVSRNKDDREAKSGRCVPPRRGLPIHSTGSAHVGHHPGEMPRFRAGAMHPRPIRRPRISAA
jgi:hypothetical protein